MIFIYKKIGDYSISTCSQFKSKNLYVNKSYKSTLGKLRVHKPYKSTVKKLKSSET